jgi:HD-like signal output (HDOD) protein
LATATLRLANSALYGPCAVDTLQAAILRLGAKEIYRLAALVLVGRWGAGVADAERDPKEFSRNALRTAIGAEVLAERTGLVDTQLAYTSGLVNEVGRLALVLSCGSFLPMIRAHRELRHETWEEAEKVALGFNNAEVSWRLLSAWKFPRVLSETARFLPDPAMAPPEVAPLVAIMLAARHLAAGLDARAGAAESPKLMEPLFLGPWGLTAGLIESLTAEVRERAEQRWGSELFEGILPR